MSQIREFILHPLGVETVSGSGDVIDTLESSSGFAGVGGEMVRVLAAVMGVTPGSAIDLKVECQTDDGLFVEVGSFAQIGTITTTSIEVFTCPRRLRISWFIRGVIDPSVTFEVRAVRMV